MAWRAERQVGALPCAPDTLAVYLTHLAQVGRQVAGIGLVLTSISQAHKTQGLESPRNDARMRAVWAGIRRQLGTATKKKDPITIADLRMVGVTSPRKLIGVRDRALILLGFASSFRRSEMQTSTPRTSTTTCAACASSSSAPRPTRGHAGAWLASLTAVTSKRVLCARCAPRERRQASRKDLSSWA